MGDCGSSYCHLRCFCLVFVVFTAVVLFMLFLFGVQFSTANVLPAKDA